jgi:opacity protein-like surface antigen
MMQISKALGLFMGVAACGLATAALAQNPVENPVGFYIGAGTGQSQIRSDDPNYGYPAYYNDYQTAWQGFLGIRPIQVFGVEAEYIDFGQPSCHNYYNNYYNGNCNVNQYGLDSHPTAPAVFAVGYLPLPIPYIDVFGKAGGARLSLNVSSIVSQPCVPGSPCPNYGLGPRETVTDTKFAYGAGVQSKFPFGLTLRAEYERISSQYGDPDALMVSAMWTF